MRKIRFEDFIQEEMRDGKELMIRMKALEVTSFTPIFILSFTRKIKSNFRILLVIFHEISVEE